MQETLHSKTIEMRLFERCFLVKIQEKGISYAMDGVTLLLRESHEAICALFSKFKALRVHIDRYEASFAILSLVSAEIMFAL